MATRTVSVIVVPVAIPEPYWMLKGWFIWAKVWDFCGSKRVVVPQDSSHVRDGTQMSDEPVS